MKKNVFDLMNMKNNEKISMITCYDYSTAKLVDESGIDMILVGDSLGNVMLGYENTLAVSVNDMITYGAAVCRGAKNTFVVIDMPFMSYQTSAYDAVCNAGRIIKETNAQAVKLEGGEKYADRIKAIVDAGIPVCAHLGLTPQSVNALGGYKVQARDEESAKKLISDSLAVEKAGAFMLVLECVPEDLAKLISEKLSIPTIGIGAGKYTDGQVLVYQDMLGYSNGFCAKFVKKYLNVHDIFIESFKEYNKEVKESIFPAKENTFAIKDDVLKKLY